MGAGRASRVAVAAVAGAVLLMTLVVTWAASSGPEPVLTGAGPSRRPAATAPSAEPSPASPPPRAGATDRQQVPSDLAEALGRLLRALAAVFAVTVLAAVAVALLLLARGLYGRWQLRRRPPPPPPEIDFDVVETARRVAGSITRDAGQQRRLLTDDEQPRNGIVACWHRFEEQAADAGVAREEWETSAEFTLRVLELVDADHEAVTRLAALYREARFSDHPLDESHRTAALAALDAIHARLPAPGAELPR
jgi:Domain of unknown function (DUF4129)